MPKGALDLALIFAYLAVIVGIGVRVGRGDRTMESLVLANRRVPWWAVLGSIIAAETSAATFLGVPGESYKLLNFAYLQMVLGTILGRLLVAGFFLGTYYERRVYSIYEFLNSRFGPYTRNAAAAIFMLSRLLASGTRLFISAIIVVTAYKLVTGAEPSKAGELAVYVAAIGTLTLATALYTAIGGNRAVIWTDCLQTVFMMGAGIAVVVVLWRLVPNGWAGALAMLPAGAPRAVAGATTGPGWWAATRGVLESDYTIWAGLLGSTFTTMASHGTDQDMVQRMLAAKDIRQCQRSVVLSGLADLPIAALFLGIGVLLWAFYQTHPDPHLPRNTNEIFCYFILRALPGGIRGLVIVGLLATTMGSLSSAMTALATSYVRDFYLVRRPAAGEQKAVEVLRYATRVFGVLLVVVGSLTAAAVIWIPGSRIIPIALGAFGYTYGSLLGIFLAGLLTRHRGSDAGNGAAIVSGFLVVALLSGLPNDLAGMFGMRLYSPPDWLPVVRFTWRIFFGTVATFLVAILWPTPSDRAAASAV
jgi:SSS family transporter